MSANKSTQKQVSWTAAIILTLISGLATNMVSKAIRVNMAAGLAPTEIIAQPEKLVTSLFPPSIDPTDLLVSAGVSILVLLMMLLSADDRKTRTGAEEGSAKWATPKDMNKYMAEDPQWNLMFTATEGLCTQTNLTYRNLNVMVIGGSGTGKTRGYVKPNLILKRADNPMSFVVTDPDGGTKRECADLLRKRGYLVQALDLNHMNKSAHFNPMDYIDPVTPEASVLQLVDNFMNNTSGTGSDQKEDFWTKSERALLTSLLAYEYFTAEKPSFLAAADRVLQMKASEKNGDEKSEFDMEMETAKAIADNLRELDRQHKLSPEDAALANGIDFACRQYETYAKGAGETKKSIIISVAVRTAPLQINTVRELMTDTEETEHTASQGDWVEEDHNLALKTVGDKKTVIFLNLPDMDTSFNFIAAIMYQCLFQALIRQADDGQTGHLQYPVHMFLDEFANIGRIPNFERLIAVIRKRWISCSIIVQNLAQLKTMYKDSWETITGNCDNILYLGGKEESSEEYVSKQLGKETIQVRGSSINSGKGGGSTSWSAHARALLDEAELGKIPDEDCIYMIRGLDPFYSQKIRPISLPQDPNELKKFLKKNENSVYQGYNIHKRIGGLKIKQEKKRSWLARA